VLLLMDFSSKEKVLPVVPGNAGKRKREGKRSEDLDPSKGPEEKEEVFRSAIKAGSRKNGEMGALLCHRGVGKKGDDHRSVGLAAREKRGGGDCVMSSSEFGERRKETCTQFPVARL